MKTVPTSFPLSLSRRAKHRSTWMSRRRRDLRITRDHERFGDQRPDDAGLPGPRISSPFSAALLRTLSGVSPCATCHIISPLVRINGRDAPIRWFVQRKALDIQPPTATFPAVLCAAGPAASARTAPTRTTSRHAAAAGAASAPPLAV